MNTKEFIVTQTISADTEYIQTVKQNTFDHIDSLLATKGSEYSGKTNRFENFLDAGRSDNIQPERALWGMMLKHYISIRKFVFELVTDQRRSVDKWSEKIDDMITYLILLKAMIRRRTHIEQVIDAGQDREANTVEGVMSEKARDAIRVPDKKAAKVKTEKIIDGNPRRGQRYA